MFFNNALPSKSSKNWISHQNLLFHLIESLAIFWPNLMTIFLVEDMLNANFERSNSFVQVFETGVVIFRADLDGVEPTGEICLQLVALVCTVATLFSEMLLFLMKLVDLILQFLDLRVSRPCAIMPWFHTLLLYPLP